MKKMEGSAGSQFRRRPGLPVARLSSKIFPLDSAPLRAMFRNR
eukprot:SAG31_NODE_230_length_19771_cov_90.041739_6_plen_43_part_00